MLTTRPRGTNDFMPGEVEKWQYVEQVFRNICHKYAYGEIRTPIFEHTELFLRGVGETTDIVEKEMYTFSDRSNRSITLRPENTAAVVRAYLEHKLFSQVQPTKLYYIGPMFRYDKPQAGRYRQFHQVGLEILGAANPSADAESIVVAIQFLKSLGLKMTDEADDGSLTLFINSIGCPNCRPNHMDELKEYLKINIGDLCDDCQNRFERNPLRILDCKNASCQEITRGAPDIINFLCTECSNHFTGLKAHLDSVGITYTINPRLVRGLDYYTKTTYEITSNALGSQSSVCGGGRYDGLVELCGGDPTPGVGFALGIERLILTVEKKGNPFPNENTISVFVASIGKESSLYAFSLTQSIRSAGISAESDMLGRSLRGQMKLADKLKAKIVVIVGEDELKEGFLTIRNMGDGAQYQVPSEKILDEIASKLSQ